MANDDSCYYAPFALIQGREIESYVSCLKIYWLNKWLFLLQVICKM